ncbi:MAG: ribose-phosphate diphosphokinase [Nitrosopumilaceae archaeon]
MATTVIAGSASIELATKIAKKLNAQLIIPKTRIFPDGEQKISFNKPKKGKIVVVQSTHPPVDANLFQALCLIFQARQFAPNIIAVMPYVGYARQDKSFLSGEITTISVIASLLKEVGASQFIVVDIHSNIALHYFHKIRNLTAVPLLANYFKKFHLKDPIVVSPDLYWRQNAKKFAQQLGLKSYALHKQRNRKTGKLTIKKSHLPNIEGHDIILLDDMLSSGNTIVTASQYLRKRNCGKIFVACTHAILVKGAEEKIRKSGVTKIISTNTIPNPTNEVDVSEMIANSIQQMRSR